MDKNKTLEEGLKKLFENYWFSIEKDALDVYLSKEGEIIQIYPKSGIKMLSIIPIQGGDKFKFLGLNYNFHESAISISSGDINYFISLVPKKEE